MGECVGGRWPCNPKEDDERFVGYFISLSYFFNVLFALMFYLLFYLL